MLIKSYVVIWALSKFILTEELSFAIRDTILVSNDLGYILSISFLPDSLTFWKCI